MMFFSSLLLFAASVQAHYHFSKLVIGGKQDAAEWTYVRQTKNYQSNGPVTDVGSADMRCYQMRGGSGTATIAAGETLGFVAVSQITHFGPLQFYMAKVPESANINSWEAAGNVWFKVAKIDAIQTQPMGSDAKTWPAFGKSVVDFKIPTALPSGKYLVRVESIALHQASNAGGAQMYISCAQVEVTGGGNGTPGPLVAFPGAYSRNDPGLVWSYYPVRTSYTAPGPAVWTGGNFFKA
ncbi:glycoside hydrolase family 61 protein-like protein [Polyplosphaeria fusca]|uniref:lytic cellulose monooxygenase (C4-dehydrogenating) n=1 Tax=Polyplosphaeria fusca TaxID=682080 RepID=A0A9P4USK0_9PLEO|nr:glycoside hydrolase family 61 protein-like protein [Polyplosphaeria fusca]